MNILTLSNSIRLKSNLKLLLLLSILFTFSCKKKELQILGVPTIQDSQTIYPVIPEFEYFNQDSQRISLQSLGYNIHIASFFFTSCPTICPKVMRSMSRIADLFADKNNISYLCFSLDSKRDSIPRLKEYYDKVGLNNKNFHLLRGIDMNDSKKLAQHYLSTASEDPEAAGGINHSGWILLVDKNRHLRSYADGTNTEDVDRFIGDIKILLNEKN
ncbi:MAG: SCO family protein [Saprospiraceae bacterium]|nr:SCO family protein [Saprospiraceae bacterium]